MAPQAEHTMTVDDLSDEEFRGRFESGSLPAASFGHRQHVRMGWLFVRSDGMPEALSTFPNALRRFAESHGATTLYHATITWAFLLLIHERQQRAPATTWQAFAEANPDLQTWKPSVLDRFYRADTLQSALAKGTFVMPDRLEPV